MAASSRENTYNRYLSQKFDGNVDVLTWTQLRGRRLRFRVPERSSIRCRFSDS